MYLLILIKVIKLMPLMFASPNSSTSFNPSNRSGVGHGVVLWMAYQLTEDISVSTGLLQMSDEMVSG